MNQYHRDILQLNSENYDATIRKIKKDIENKNIFCDIISQIFCGINFRPNKIKLYVKLSFDLCCNCMSFKEYFVEMIMNEMNTSKQQFLFFVHLLMEMNVVSKELIVSKIIEFYKQPVIFSCAMYAWFYQECYELIEDDDFYEEMDLSINKSTRKNGKSRQHPMTPLSSRLYVEFDDSIQKLLDNNNGNIYEQLQNPIINALMDDNVEDLMRFVVDYSMIIKASILLPHNSLLFLPSLIQAAAFYGSLKCFNYILSKNPDLKYLDTRKKCLLDFAIMGGNYEIIEICMKKGFEVCEYSLNQATIYSYFDIFEWFLPMVSSVNWEKIFTTACKSEALIIVKKALEHNIPNEIVGTNLVDAAKEGKLEILKYLISLSIIDVNYELQDHNNSFTIAAQYNKFDIIKYLITIDMIDVNHNGIY